MKHNPVRAIKPPPDSPLGPWRYVLLDRNPADPKYVIATVASIDDVMPASLDAAGRYLDWQLLCAWAETRVGNPVQLRPVDDALAWLIEKGRPRFAVVDPGV